MVEQLPLKQTVPGSSPGGRTDKMNSKIYYYIGIGFLIFLVVGGGILFNYAAFGDLLGKDKPLVINKYTPPTGLRVTQDGTLYFVWQDLPDGTTAVNIYRARKDTQEWKLWKTVQINGDLSDGSIQLQTSGIDGLDGFIFYYEAVNSSGDVLWESEEDEIAPLVPTEDDTDNNEAQTDTDSGTSTSNTSGSDNDSEESSTPPNNNPTSTEDTAAPTSTTSANETSTVSEEEAPTSYPTGTIIYYTPSGDVSGTKIYDSSFWVEVVNNRLEFGWQDLPSLTDRVTIQRSSSGSGSWTTILQQQNPETEGPYTISLLDAAVSSPFYYRLRAFAGSTELSELGPLYVE